MTLQDLLPDVHKPADLVATLAGGAVAYWAACKLTKKAPGKMYKAQPLQAAASMLGGFVVGHLGYVEYEKHAAAATPPVSGYLGM